MPIAQLSDGTARLLRSTLVLNDGASVVKELVDNALDAHATAISIEISANALDIIQVRDNGSGIAADDRRLLCKRGCTSKIRTLDDLESLGGNSLGFRGEALSSIAELSGHVFITTRVEGEAVGTSMKFDPQGNIIRSSSVPHPIGTTINVQKFLSPIPVRKQAASKASSKVLMNVKRMLIAFAFVRPWVRYSLKVIKRQNERANWSFAPMKGSNLLASTAMQIFGKETSTCCKSYRVSSTEMDGECYQAVALLLDPAADLPKAIQTGQFVTVDGRPVTAERGLMGDISKAYRRYVQSAFASESKIPSKPFLVLQITCPTSSYDVNIEPAKDEVLFYQSDLVLEMVRNLFSEVYGPIPERENQLQKSKATAKSSDTPFNLLLARKGAGAVNQGAAASTPSQHQITSVNTYANDAEDENSDNSNLSNEILSQTDDIAVESEQPVTSDAWARNPFSTAALHTKIKSKNLAALESTDDIIDPTRPIDPAYENPSSIPVRLSRSYQELGHQPAGIVQFLPSPSRSPVRREVYQNPGPPIPRHARHNESSDEDEVVSDRSLHESAARPQRSFLRNWVASSDSRQIPILIPDVSESVEIDGVHRGAVTQSPQNTIKTYITSLTSERHSPKPHQRAFKPPLMRTTPMLVDREAVYTDMPSMLSSRQDPELDEIMDFEHRKRAVNQPAKRLQGTINPAELANIQRGSTIGPGDRTISNLSDKARLQQIREVDDDGEDQRIHLQLRNNSDRRNEAGSRPSDSRDTILARDASMGEDDFANHKAATLTGPGILTTPWKPTITESISSVEGTLTSSHVSEEPSSMLQQNRRGKVGLTPFERIPRGHIKHNIQYLPINPFPTPSLLRSQMASLKPVESYITTGRIDTVTWSPFSRHIQTWEETLDHLIITHYRPNSVLQTPGKQAQHGATQSSPGTQPHIQIPGSRKVNLVQAIKGHLSLLDDDEH